MKIKIIGIFLCIFLTTTCIPVSGNIGLIKNSIFDNESTSYDPLDGGWVEEIDGVTILHLSGTNYEMGYQYGYYLKDEIVENIRCANDFCDNHGWPLEKRIDIWNIQEKYLPQVYIDEMIGMADGSGISFDSIAIHNGWLSVFNVMKCLGASLWNTATKDGELLHMRSADGTFGAKDPVTGKFIHENTVLIVRNPDNAHASIYPDFCGNVVSIGGMNEKGVCVSELTITSSDTNFQGINGGFRMRMVLDYADDIYEANEIMNSNRTCGWNFVISDGNFPVGLAIEQSANFEYTGMWCDPVESTEPFWEIRDVVRRNNCYINPLLAKTARDRYKPNGVIGLVRLILRKDGTFIPWTQYKAFSNEIEKQHGTLDLNSTMDLFRDVYNGETNLMFRYMQNRNFYSCGHQWVGCPKTGELVISFGDHENNAFVNPVHYFNFYELLNSDQP